VIFFTSKLADNTEIIAILSSGVSFKRMMYPYFLSAAIIALLTFILSGYIIPPANQVRLKFEDTYVKKVMRDNAHNVQMQSGGLYRAVRTSKQRRIPFFAG
jgi:lipopolysaccharide export system permease protein